MIDGDKREFLAERAEGLLHSLKQRFPSLTQTTLDTSKIQFNKVTIVHSSTFSIMIHFLPSSFHLVYISTFAGCWKVHS